MTIADFPNLYSYPFFFLEQKKGLKQIRLNNLKPSFRLPHQSLQKFPEGRFFLEGGSCFDLTKPPFVHTVEEWFGFISRGGSFQRMVVVSVCVDKGRFNHTILLSKMVVRTGDSLYLRGLIWDVCATHQSVGMRQHFKKVETRPRSTHTRARARGYHRRPERVGDQAG